MALHKVLVVHIKLKVTLQKPRDKHTTGFAVSLLPAPAPKKPISSHIVLDNSKMGTATLSELYMLLSFLKAWTCIVHKKR